MESDVADAEEIVSRAQVLYYSELFVSGKHASHAANQDLTNARSDRRLAAPENNGFAMAEMQCFQLSGMKTVEVPQPLQWRQKICLRACRKSLQNQKAEAGKRKAEAYLDGHLLPEEAWCGKRPRARRSNNPTRTKTRRQNVLWVTALTNLKKRKSNGLPGL